MNTIRSTWLGWGTFIVAGAGSYYFAKKSVNADRQARHEEEMKKRRLKASLEAEFNANPPPAKRKKRKTLDPAASPSTEASQDPAPTEHAVDAEPKSQEMNEYLPNKPYRSRKGDRFS